jgi:hypothetical protein
MAGDAANCGLRPFVSVAHGIQSDYAAVANGDTAPANTRHQRRLSPTPVGGVAAPVYLFTGFADESNYAIG